MGGGLWGTSDRWERVGSNPEPGIITKSEGRDGNRTMYLGSSFVFRIDRISVGLV